jgi:rubrerythrin
MPTKTAATTLENLKTAFAGESQANRKYLAFSQQAAKDGFKNVARLFKITAEAETIHAFAHLKAMGMVGSTAANLKAAVSGETYEYKEMYPPMVESARKEGHRAQTMFGYAVKAEAVHAKLYAAALAAVESGKDLEGAEFYLCPVCGNIEMGKPAGPCPICGLPADKFQRID